MRFALHVAALLAVAVAACGGDPGAAAPDGARATDAGLDATVVADLAEAPAPDLGGGPPYPIVLVHGMAGFNHIGPLMYFYGVADALRKDGHDVWVSTQDPFNDSVVRGEQVRQFVAMVLAQTGKRKVNLVGHSQGGFDVRYVASLDGDHVASVTTISSPMGGDPIADVAMGLAPGPLSDALSLVLDVYGLGMGYDSNAKAGLMQLTTQNALAFFKKYPDDPNVAYFSIAGRSEGSTGDQDCATDTPAPFVSRWDSQVDQLDPIFAAGAAILDAQQPKPTHDGLVPVGSARHGRFLGCIPADHLDEVGLPPGASPGPGNSFDHIEFFRDLARWLVQQGY